MPITESIVASPAKINLYLKILGRRSDGYHELDTLFYPVTDLFDTIRIEPGHDENMFMRCPERPELETTSNLIYKAWKAYGAVTGFRPGVFVTLNKRIPLGGGLGGGSSNAATMLRWLNDNADDKRLSDDKLLELAASLGADVPFFLFDGPARALGIGEKLEAADAGMAGKTLLLVFPDVHVDTGWAFRTWDEKNHTIAESESLTSEELDTKNPVPVSPTAAGNDFEPIVFARHPVLDEIKAQLLHLGASSAAMSGSGATLFGIFEDQDTAAQAASVLEEKGFEIFRTNCH